MQNLIVIALLALTAIGGTYQYLQYSAEQEALQLEQARFQADKEAFDQALGKDSIPALNQFIFDHPDSQWLDKARYQRDKLLYQQAVASKQASSIQKFLEEHPQSAWRQHAELALQRLQNQARHQAELKQKQAELDAQREKLHTRTKQSTKSAAPGSGQSTVTTSAVPVPKSGSRNGQSSRERIERALSIYKKQRQQEQKAAHQRDQQRQREDDIRRQCISLKDQINQYGQNRVRWYELDQNGERIFLSKSQVKTKRDELEQQYQTHCN